jgi:hypothetical protein
MAVVDVSTGSARTAATGVQLAYFNPGCGPGDRALLTRSIGLDGEQTDLLSVDAATATVTGTRRIKAQFTSPTPAVDGDYGVVGGDLVKVDNAGSFSAIGKPTGAVFATRTTARRHRRRFIANGTVSVQRFARDSIVNPDRRSRRLLFGLKIARPRGDTSQSTTLELADWQ